MEILEVHADVRRCETYMELCQFVRGLSYSRPPDVGYLNVSFWHARDASVRAAILTQPDTFRKVNGSHCLT